MSLFLGTLEWSVRLGATGDRRSQLEKHVAVCVRSNLPQKSSTVLCEPKFGPSPPPPHPPIKNFWIRPCNGRAIWISLQPDWQIDNNFFNKAVMALRGPCVRKLLTGLIMYIYPLKIKNIVLYCIVLLTLILVHFWSQGSSTRISALVCRRT